MSFNRRAAGECPGSCVAVKVAEGRPSSEENTIGFHMIRSIISINRSEPILNAFMKMATRLWVIELDGWEESPGVTFERTHFLAANKPVEVVHPDAVADMARELARNEGFGK